MKKILFSFFLLFISYSLFSENVVISNFESGFIGKWGTNGNPTSNATNEDHANFSIADNPSITGINLSQKVGQFHRLRSGLWWAYAWFEFTPISVVATLNSPKYLHVSMYKPLTSTVCAQLLNLITGATVNTGEITNLKQTKVNDWQEVVFKISTTGTFSFICIKPDFVNAVVSTRLTGDIDIYFDNIYINDDPTPMGETTIPPFLGNLPENFEGTSTLLDPIDYCGDRFGSFIQAFANTDLTVVDNPLILGNTSDKCAKFVRKQAGPWNAGLFMIPTAPMIANATNKYFHIMVYKTMESPINLKLENGSPVASTGDLTITPLTSDVNKWTDYVFEIPAAKYSTYGKISLFPDFIQTPAPSARFTENQNIYFDAIELNDSPSLRFTITQVADNKQNNLFQVWSDSKGNICLKNNQDDGCAVSLYDITGRVLKMINYIPTGTTIIPMNGLSGIYLLKARNSIYKLSL
jgi:hypothetical protein